MLILLPLVRGVIAVCAYGMLVMIVDLIGIHVDPLPNVLTILAAIAAWDIGGKIVRDIEKDTAHWRFPRISFYAVLVGLLALLAVGVLWS